MYHEVKWNEELINNFIEKGHLSKKEAELIRLRADDKTAKEQSEALGTSIRTVNRKVGDLKLLYDKLSASDPVMFPPRKIKLDYPANLCEFDGKIYFSVDRNEDDIKAINLTGKEFNSSKEMINYIYSQVCTICNKSLAEINEIRFSNNIRYTVKFTK